MPRLRPLDFPVLPFVFSICAIATGAAGFGFLRNLEPCVPTGFYAYAPVMSAIRRGDTVVVCPPTNNAAVQFAAGRGWLSLDDHSPCTGGLRPYLKTVGAVAGDTVLITPEAVFVNGSAVPNSASLSKSRGGAPMPHVLPLGAAISVPEGSYFALATGSIDAFDSRYMGILPAATAVRKAWLL